MIARRIRRSRGRRVTLAAAAEELKEEVESDRLPYPPGDLNTPPHDLPLMDRATMNSRNNTSTETNRFYAAMTFLGLLAMTANADAAAPKFTALFPAGGQQGTELDVTVSGTLDPWPLKVHTDSPGLTITPEKDKGKLKISIAADAAPRVHWFRLYNDEGATQPIAFAVGIVPEMNETEPNDDPTKPNKLENSPMTVNGVLSKSEEVDIFAVEAKKGQTLVASLAGNTILGSPMDAVLQLVSADGFVLAQNDDYHGRDPQITYPITVDGTYLVRTFAFPATPDSSIRFSGGSQYVYRLTVTTGGFADVPYPLVVNRSQPGPVSLLGWNLSDQAQAVQLAAPQEGDGQYVSPPEVANSTFIGYVDFPSVVEQAGSEKQEIVPPIAVTGKLATSGEIDTYTIQAKKGDRLQFSVNARSMLLPLDPVITITDASGKVLKEVDDSGRSERDVETDFTAAADGPLHVQVKDLHRRGGERFVYLLKVTPIAPDFSLSLAAEQFTLTPGTPLEVDVTINRRNGFDDEIEILTKGLPEGVKAEPVEAESKDTKDEGERRGRRRGRSRGDRPVKLKLTAETGPASGVFQIVGVSQGETKIEKTAAATVPNHTATTDQPWLTVLAPPPKEEKKEEEKKEEKK